MFTGLVEHVGRLQAVRPTQAGARLTVDVGPLDQGLKLGDSLCLSGACQTVAAIRGSLAEFDAVPETLRRTTLGQLRPGAAVNLERSLAVGDRLGGHFVSGHVDAVAELVRRPAESAGEQQWRFHVDNEVAAQMVAKGSIAIDGVSLTLVDVAADSFSVALIPTTLKATTLGNLQPGDKVNIETDMLGKYVRRAIAAMIGRTENAESGGGGGGLTIEKLRQAGFAE